MNQKTNSNNGSFGFEFERITVEKSMLSPVIPQAVLGKNGTLRFNRPAVKKFKLDRHQFMALFVRNDKSVIRCKPVEMKTDATDRTITQAKNGTATVSITALMPGCGLEKGKIYTFTLLSNDGYIILHQKGKEQCDCSFIEQTSKTYAINNVVKVDINTSRGE